MDSKNSGRLFLTIVLCFITVDLLLAFTPLRDYLDTVALMVLSELAFMVPAVIFFLMSREAAGDVFALKGIKFSAALLCIPYTWFVLPLGTVFNIFTMFFVDNRATEIFQSLSGAGLILTVLFVAVIAPICEELTFRGIIFTGLRRSGSAMQAIFISAALFGLFHMNINQALYAFAIGVFFAALREVTGSVIPSMICHIMTNGGSVFFMVMQRDQLMDEERMEAIMESAMNGSAMFQALGIFIMLAFAGVALALCVLAYIAKKQGAVEKMRAIWDERVSRKGKVADISLIIGSALAVIYIIVVYILEKMAVNMKA